MTLSTATALLYIETSDPDSAKDAAHGYAIGNWWLNSTSKSLFMAKDITNNAAIWDQYEVVSTSLVGSSIEFTSGPTITFGSGVPNTSEPKGSLYLRTDGTALTGRLYVATNSTGSWTSFSSIL